MPTVADFMAEVDAVFGFFFDISMACEQARAAIDRLRVAGQKVSDDSPLTYGDGPPTGTPEDEWRKAFNRTTIGGLKQRMAVGGYDQNKAAETAIVFTFHIWEEKYRGRISGKDGKPIETSDVMGDLRLIRNSIIHNKGIAKDDVARCKTLTFIKPGEAISFRVEDIFNVITAIRREFKV
jgi:hypothetical protein